MSPFKDDSVNNGIIQRQRKLDSRSFACDIKEKGIEAYVHLKHRKVFKSNEDF